MTPNEREAILMSVIVGPPPAGGAMNLAEYYLAVARNLYGPDSPFAPTAERTVAQMPPTSIVPQFVRNEAARLALSLEVPDVIDTSPPLKASTLVDLLAAPNSTSPPGPDDPDPW